MKIAFSTCPNDTFIFYALVHGLVPGAPKFDVTYADIDVTNHLAINSTEQDVLKISYAALPWVLSEYALLPCGGALGRGCGPLLLTASKTGNLQEPALRTGQRVAIPGERSTACLLFRLWAAQQLPGVSTEIVVMPFCDIMPAVRAGEVDAGLVIHEARFTYPSYGLTLLVDLGRWWEADTSLPIPLGAIIARRSLDLDSIAGWIKASVHHAWAHPEASRRYIMHHAQELSPEVAQAHIDLYVNQFTENIGEIGYQAITTLLNRAAQAGLIPMIDPSDLHM